MKIKSCTASVLLTSLNLLKINPILLIHFLFFFFPKVFLFWLYSNMWTHPLPTKICNLSSPNNFVLSGKAEHTEICLTWCDLNHRWYWQQSSIFSPSAYHKIHRKNLLVLDSHSSYPCSLLLLCTTLSYSCNTDIPFCWY